MTSVKLREKLAASRYCGAEVLTYLGTLPGAEGAQPLAINSSGQVVGFTDTSGAPYATLREGKNAIDLNDRLTSSGMGWTLEYADAINDSGEIVGWGINPQGQIDAFPLTPCTHCQIDVVPESPTWSMMLLGFAGLGGLLGITEDRRRIGIGTPQERFTR